MEVWSNDKIQPFFGSKIPYENENNKVNRTGTYIILVEKNAKT